ncbi:MAG: hypothetical protein VX085_06170, partial [Pseudomonadota bacterium]|nr:hypothetical protein [Pseudomonadota bacterium]
ASAIDLFPDVTSLKIIAFAFMSASMVIGQMRGVALIDRARHGPSPRGLDQPRNTAKTVI